MFVQFLKLRQICSPSGTDASLLNYAIYKNKYRAMAFMLLCDDTERDYGNPETAASFAETCRALGFETISMRDEFETIYKTDAVKTAFAQGQAA